MATYTEIRDLFDDSDLLNRIQVAVIISANGLADSPDNNTWVAQAYASPKTEARKALMAVLAENNTATVSAIQTSTDAALQTNVDTVVAILVKALAGA